MNVCVTGSASVSVIVVVAVVVVLAAEVFSGHVSFRTSSLLAKCFLIDRILFSGLQLRVLHFAHRI